MTTDERAITAGPGMPTADAVAALVAFADECQARGDTWLERLALQEAMGLARLGNRSYAALWERIDALVDVEDGVHRGDE